MRLGERVAAMRQARGWSQAELGRRVGIAPSTIMRIERGADQNISQSTLMGLAIAFGCRPADLLEDAPPAPGAPVAQLRAAGFAEDKIAALVASWPGLTAAEQARYRRHADVLYAEYERLQTEKAALQADLDALRAEQERMALEVRPRRRRLHPAGG